MTRARRKRRWLWLLVLLPLILFFAPVAVVESVCVAPREPATSTAPRFVIDDPDYRRDEMNSYLSYPEWQIVYAYQDFAAMLRSGDEWRFGYLASVMEFWSDLCGVNRIAAAKGGGSLDQKAMLYIIGASFSVEMAIKGGYETTLGRFAAWIRGAEPNQEDLVARRMAQDYTDFLYQTPWYEYPFARELRRLLTETPFGEPSVLRSIERRFALGMEWGVKALYGRALAAAAGLSPSPLRIGTVVAGLDAADLAADPRITIVRPLGGGVTLIDTPRYGDFTQIVEGLSSRGRQILEIAGNREVLATFLASGASSPSVEGAEAIFANPIQSRPGWRRVGYRIQTSSLTAAIRALQQQGATLEHVYDY